nr:pyruvate carboxylase [Nocardioidaceae bacterium]
PPGVSWVCRCTGRSNRSRRAVTSVRAAGALSRPAMSALVASTDATDRATGLSLDAVCDLEPYWEATRRLYAPFESGLPAPTGRVYTHEIPGGQLSNLRQQAIALGLGEKFEQIEDMYAAANDILGNIVKVTPSSKVVGDLALHLVAVGADPAEFAADPASFDVPDSVIGFLSGELGDPPGGWPEPFRTKALAGRTVKRHETELGEADAAGLKADRRTTLNRLLFPGPTKEFSESRERYSDLAVLPTRDFLYGLASDDEHDVYLQEGVRLILAVESISKPDERGFRTVMCTINGQLRPVSVRDRSVSPDAPTQERADPTKPGQIGAPFDGVVSPVVAVGDTVDVGDVVATIEAMKMEASITTSVAGTVERVALDGPRSIEGGDLVVVVTPA